jgi:hypothetical protein
MQEAVLGKESLTRAQQNVQAYFQNHDVQYLSEDAVFKLMGTGQEYRGRAEIGGLLHYMYHVAFDAKAEIKNYEITERKAFFDGFFKGRHIGEFAGVPPTQKEVNVPICASYDVEDGLITEGRLFMMNDVLMQQLGAPSAAPRQKTTFITRDIFRLKFGHFKEVKALLEEALKTELLHNTNAVRVLSDFTGDAYRLILEEGFNSLTEYEQSLSKELGKEEWQKWYEKFKPHVESSHREILKQVM